MATELSTLELKGWEVVRLQSPHLEVDVLPGKGGDILAVTWVPTRVNLLWESPWGLRPRGAVSTAKDSVARFLENYPGGWQTIFPNGGDAASVSGIEWGFHGEAALVPWDWTPIDGGVELSTRLTQSPFELSKKIWVDSNQVRVTETATNVGPDPQQVMWSHHPAFGAPFISGDTTVQCGASTFIADDERDVEAGDLEPGAESDWPKALTREGTSADISRLPDRDTSLDRFGYLTGFDEGWASIESPSTGITARLEWNARIFPHAWYWLEAHATAGFPWFGQAYVFAIEPASSYPGQGVQKVREKTGTLLSFDPGESRSVELSLSVEGRGGNRAE